MNATSRKITDVSVGWILNGLGDWVGGGVDGVGSLRVFICAGECVLYFVAIKVPRKNVSENVVC